MGLNETERLNISHLYLLMIQFYFVVHLHSNSYISRWFSSVEAVTSLKVNVGKSEVVPVGEVDNLVALVDKVVELLVCQ